MRISDWSSDVCSSDLMGLVGAEAVELGPHRAAIGAEHADLDEIAGLDVGAQEEWPCHMVEVVACGSIEAECHRRGVAFDVAMQRDRKDPANMRGGAQRTVSAVVDIQLVPASSAERGVGTGCGGAWGFGL